MEVDLTAIYNVNEMREVSQMSEVSHGCNHDVQECWQIHEKEK